MEFDRSPVLELESISKRLGKRQILNNISLKVYPGEVFGFLGPNGSGKTTTIKLLLGLLKIETGSIKICGKNVVTEFEEAVANVGGIIENPELYKYLSGRENLENYARMFGDIAPERIDELAKLVHLSERIDDKVAKYSLGMRQRLGLAQALLNKPKILVLDEPTNGLDPAGIKDLRDTLKNLAHNEGTAVFISSHQLAELDLICDRIGIINNGTLIETLTIEEVRNSGNGSKPTLSIGIDGGSADKVPEKYAYMKTEFPGRLKGSVEREEIPEIVSELCASGVRIFSVQTEKHSIEDVFLQLTSEDPVPENNGGAK